MTRIATTPDLSPGLLPFSEKLKKLRFGRKSSSDDLSRSDPTTTSPDSIADLEYDDNAQYMCQLTRGISSPRSISERFGLRYPDENSSSLNPTPTDQPHYEDLRFINDLISIIDLETTPPSTSEGSSIGLPLHLPIEARVARDEDSKSNNVNGPTKKSY